MCAMALSPCGGWLATAGLSVTVWDAATGEEGHHLWARQHGRVGYISSMALTAGGAMLVASSRSTGVLEIFNVSSSALLHRLNSVTGLGQLSTPMKSHGFAASLLSSGLRVHRLGLRSCGSFWLFSSPLPLRNLA